MMVNLFKIFIQLKSLFWKEDCRSEEYQVYAQQLDSARVYQEWASSAAALDKLDGYAEWKERTESGDYDYKLLQSRIDEILEIRSTENDRRAMCFTLKLGLSRNLGNMGNSNLYEYTRVGTKKLISEYTNQVVDQLHWIGEPSSDMSLKEKHEYFMNLRQAHGRTALLLSGGGTLGFYHVGVARALAEHRLLPRVISGASAGSIMAAIICSRNSEERLKLLRNPQEIPRDVFESPTNPDTLWIRMKRYYEKGSFYDSTHLKRWLINILGGMTFQEAYNVSHIVLNIAISPSSIYEMPRVLNYITAPNVVIWSAVMASCSVPLFFPEGLIYAKDKKGNLAPWTPTDDRYRDGSIDTDLPMKRLSELFNVNHFIVIQVNPHIAPVMYNCLKKTYLSRAVLFALKMAKDEILHRCQQLKELGLFQNFAIRTESVLSQKYAGDITVVPKLRSVDFQYLLSNPSFEHANSLIQRGERDTWKQMSKIENSLKIELTTDSIIHKIRRELLGNSPQISNEILASSPYIDSFIQTSLKHDDDDDDSEEGDTEYRPLAECHSPFDLPPTPLWLMDTYLENPLKEMLFPHDISRRDSNLSIRNMSPSITRAERRKQITSTQFFILPEMDWIPEKTPDPVLITKPTKKNSLNRKNLSVVIPKKASLRRL